MNSLSKEESGRLVKALKQRHVLQWTIIVVLFLLTIVVALWASRRPEVMSIWGSGDD